MNHRVARALRRWISSLAVCGYLAAAAMPCPPPVRAAAPNLAGAPGGVASHATHRGHGGRAESVDASRAGAAAVIAAPCHCGCGERTGGATASRLGPVLPPEAVVFAPARACAPAIVCSGDATSLALAPPDPVPISHLA